MSARSAVRENADHAARSPVFEDLYDRAACGLVSTSIDDVVLSVNQTFLDWSGHTREAVLGTQFHALLTKGSQLFYETRSLPVLHLNGEVREVALTLVAADGSSLPILFNANVVAGSDEVPSEVRIAVFDSTVRQGYERELLDARRSAEESEAKVRLLQDASVLFSAADSEDSLAAMLVDRSRNAFAASAAAVLLIGADRSMRVAAGDELRGMLTELWAMRPAISSADRSPFVVFSNLDEAQRQSARAAEILRRERFEALTAVGLFDGDVAVGVLVCLFRRSREFDASTSDLHQALARQAAAGLIRIRLQRDLEQMALHDQLTGLANRNLLRERLTHAISSAQRTQRPMSLIFLDLDGFKKVNDELGHRAGDAVLQTAATRIANVIRAADIVGRFGGDEFLVICEDADEGVAVLIADRLREALKQPIDDLPATHMISASVGISIFDPASSPVPTNDSLFRLADAAMYVSKHSGADRTTVDRA